jgi:sugar lactone lactonase YvrE
MTSKEENKIEGDKAGTHDVLIEGLPGFPDNIRTDSDGDYCLAMPSLREPLLDSLVDKPKVRKAMAKLLNYVKFPVKAMVLAINPQGTVVANLQSAMDGSCSHAFPVTQVGWLQSFASPFASV